MKMYFKSLIFALTGALMITACSNEIEEQLAENGKNGQNVKFSIGVENLSRTAIADGTLVTSFEQNDEIGIFAYDGEKLVSSNVKYTYNGSEWTSENAIAAQDGVKLSYYAYYPYDASVTDPASIKDTVSADQTAGFGKNDMLSARNTEAAAGATNISLKFAHAMAMVQVSLMEGTTSDANATVTLQSILPVTSVNAKDGSVTAASGASVGVAMKKAAESLTYRAVVPEQTIEAGSKLLTIVADGKTFNVIFDADVKYERGKLLQITVNKLNALPDGAEVTIGGAAIDGWTPGENPEGGETEEVPLIQPVSSEFPEVVSDTREFKEESWFKLVQNDKERLKATFEMVDDNATDWHKAIKLTYDGTSGESVNNAWYKVAIGYNHIEPIYVQDTYKYKVTAKIKADACDSDGTISRFSFTCKSKDTETVTDENTGEKGRYKWSFAMGTNPSSCTATLLGITPKVVGTWETYTFYIDFSKVASTVTSKPELVESSPKDYNGFDLRIYTDNKGKKSVIYVSDVLMEPYQE